MKTQTKNRQFTVLIERDEDGYFVGSVPALPGCYTQAKSLNELKARIIDAISACLSLAKEDAGYRKKIAQFSYEPLFFGMEVVTV